MKYPKFSIRQFAFFQFVKDQHGEQVRSYTGDPYYIHLMSVADTVLHIRPDLVEVAMGHDLLEDTDCKTADIWNILKELQYTKSERSFIVDGIIALTDQYTKEAYPELNRKARKQMEAMRLGSIDPAYQTVKLADLIDNSVSIIEHDDKFARVYIQEKVDILDKMRLGDIGLFMKCCAIVSKFEEERN